MSKIIPVLPHLIALCNVTSLVLLVMGAVAIRRRDERRHQRFMMGAVGVAVVFLICYTIYHGTVGNVAFAGEGISRKVYFTILISHVVLATLLVPMVPMTLAKARKGQKIRHRYMARKTLPIWIYVSLSGIAVYVMAFHLFPS